MSKESDEDWMRERLLESEELLRFAAKGYQTRIEQLTRERDEYRGYADALLREVAKANDWGRWWKKRYGELYVQVNGPGKSRRKKKAT